MVQKWSIKWKKIYIVLVKILLLDVNYQPKDCIKLYNYLVPHALTVGCATTADHSLDPALALISPNEAFDLDI